MWVIEFDGVAQLGHPEQYYAIEQAEENFGSSLDANGNAYVLRLYAPSGDVMSREACLKIIGTDEG